MSASFESAPADLWLAQAAALRAEFHADAVARDKAGGRPVAQAERLRQSGLLAAPLPTRLGGGGARWQSVLRAVRELARTDGSLAHLYGYHFLPLHTIAARASAPQADTLLGASAAGRWLWGNAGNVMSPTSSARRVDGGWLVQGHRPFSSGSHVADRILISWDDARGLRQTAAVPTDREGLFVEDDWDGIGQRQTGSGTVRFQDLHVSDEEVVGRAEDPLTPFASLVTLLQQSVLLNVFLGSAQGALDEGRAYTIAQSRPWIHSGVQRHVDDPWVQRRYGELASRVLAAVELAEQAGHALDAAYAYGAALTHEARGQAAITIATANLYAGEAGLAAGSGIFEVMGARSATTANGFDRFWRNVRTHTLHNPAEYKKRTIGRWLLTGDYPEPAPYR